MAHVPSFGIAFAGRWDLHRSYGTDQVEQADDCHRNGANNTEYAVITSQQHHLPEHVVRMLADLRTGRIAIYTSSSLRCRLAWDRGTSAFLPCMYLYHPPVWIHGNAGHKAEIMYPKYPVDLNGWWGRRKARLDPTPASPAHGILFPRLAILGRRYRHGAARNK